MNLSVQEFFEILKRLRCRCVSPERPIATAILAFGPAEGDMAKGFIDLDQTSISSVLVLKDKAGADVTPDAPPVWTLGDPTIASITVAADGLSASFAPLAVGVTTVNVSLDAEIGTGEREMLLSGELEVTAGDIVTGEVTFGAPQD